MEIIDAPFYFHKILIFGDKQVGKTSLISQLAKRNINHKENDSISVYKFTLEHGDKIFGVIFYEILTEELTFKIFRELLYDTEAAIFMFSLSDIETFSKANYTIDLLNEINNKKIKKYLIGNKSDEKHKIEAYTIKTIILEKQIEYIEMSLKNNSNINVLLENITYGFKNKDYTNKVLQYCHFNRSLSLFADTVFKLILVGDSEVGKTSFFNRFFEQDFEDSTIATVGKK
jgi:GTPase SAR1 family protein